MRKWINRIVSTLLCFAMLMTWAPEAMLRAFAADLSYVTPLSKVADTSTLDVWGELVNQYQSTQYVGRVWTDKTVSANGIELEYKLNSGLTEASKMQLQMAADTDFQVALSALSSTISIKGHENAPIDLMIVLDVSSSMYSGASYNWTNLTALTNSVNATIDKVLSLNEYNRVGVVLYHGGDRYEIDEQSKVGESRTVLLTLGRYENTGWGSNDASTENKYVNLDKENKQVTSASNLKKDGKTYNKVTRQLTDIAGTYMQLGILEAMNQFLGVNTTSSAAGDDIEHIPVMILMSDGEPTASTNTFSSVEDAVFGNNTVDYRSPVASDFVTQLTAAYAKAEIDIKYKTTSPLFYTLSLGNEISLDVMDPGKTITISGAERREAAIKELWNTLITNGSVSYWTVPHKLEKEDGVEDEKYATSTTNLSNSNGVFPSALSQQQYVNKAYTAETAGNLATAFDEIFIEIAAQSAKSPTFIESGSAESATGYITMVDALGDYMEIKSVDAITIEGEVYYFAGTNGVGSAVTKYYFENGTEATSANYDYAETTYTFTKDVSLNTILRARASDKVVTENLNVIIITERDYKAENVRDTLTVKIPASILPLRYYIVDAEGNLTIRETLPVRVVYSVGLLDKVRDALTTGNYDAVLGMKDYVSKNTKNGEIEFYSNYFDGDDTNSDGYTDGNTYSTFAPSNINSFYYYTEDTVFYKKVGNNYVPITKSQDYEADLAGTVYVPHTFYKLDNGTTTKVTGYVGMSIDKAIAVIGIRWENIDSYIGVNALNQYYMIAGNAKLSLANDTQFIDLKDNRENYGGVTDTATTVLNPTWSSNTLAGNYATYMTMNYLGNNGKITYKGLGSLKISKDVTADAGLTPNPDTVFTMEVTFAGAADGTYPAVHSGDSNITSVEITNSKATFTLKDAQSITISQLPVGATYQVVETKAMLDGVEVTSAYVESYADDDKELNDPSQPADDGKGIIALNKTEEVVVYNDYTPNEAQVQIKIEGTKALQELNNSEYSGTKLTAEFYLQRWNNVIGLGEWEYVKVDGTTTKDSSEAANGTVEYDDENAVVIDFNKIKTALEETEFTATGVYDFRIFEKNHGITTLDGVYHDPNMHSFTIEVADDGKGSLYVSDVSSSHLGVGGTDNWTENNGVWTNGVVNFVNTYGSTKLTIDIDKTVEDLTNSGYSKDEGYSFNWEFLGSYGSKTKIEALTEYSGNGKSGTTGHTTPDGITGFTIEYDVVSNQSFTVDENGVHKYNAGTATYYEYYKIAESIPATTLDGIAYSTAVYYVEVKVDVDANNNVAVTYHVARYVTSDGNKTYDYSGPEHNEHVWTNTQDSTDKITRAENDGIVFQNTYSNSTVVDLGVAKDLQGREWKTGEEFKFKLTPIQYNTAARITVGKAFDLDLLGGTAVVQATMPTTPNSITVSANENGRVSFGEIIFTEVGTYYFRVEEVVPSEAVNFVLNGVTYSSDYTLVKVDVTADANHKLSATVSTNDKGQLTAISGNPDTYTVHTFINEYDAKPVSVTLGGTKTLTGRGLKPNEFIFVLLDSTGKEISATRNLAGGAYTFSELKFDKVGEYKYTVKEIVNPALGGITYDTKVYNVTIKVTDDGWGNLLAEVFVDDKSVVDSAKDKTEYKGLNFKNEYKVQGQLILTVTKTIDGRDWQEGDKFTFHLYNTDPAQQSATPIQELQVMDISAPGGIGLGVTSISKAFDPIVYEQDETGTYTYYVKEIGENKDGIEIDSRIYVVTVVVTDDSTGDGILNVNVTYNAGAQASKVEFINKYTAEDVDASFAVNKVLDGREWLTNDSFEFVLKPVTDGAPMPNSDKLYITKDTVDATASFDKITFSAPGTYEYTITETNTGAKGILYDTTVHTVKVVVTDNGKGKLLAAVSYDGSATAGKVTFTNIYSTEGLVVISGTKKLTGRDLADGEFKFDLFATGADWKITAEAIQQVGNVGENITFAAVKLKNAGTYYFVVKENSAVKLGGITYDDTEYRITVQATDNGDGTLTAKVVDISTKDGKAEAIVFNNEYKTVNGSVDIVGDKKLTGKDLADGEFKFNLYKSDKDWKQYGKITDTTNGKDGKFAFAGIKFDAAGEYFFLVTEEDTELGGVKYDTTVYRVKIAVTDDGKGTLTAKVVDISTKDGAAEAIVFNNKFTPPPTDIDVTIDVNKTVKNIGTEKLGPEDFEFLLKKITQGGELKVKTDKNGFAQFKLTFSEADIGKSYKYTLSEVKGDSRYVKYSEVVYDFEIKISLDEKNNKLVATLYSGGKTAEKLVGAFENIFDYKKKPPVVGDGNNLIMWFALLFVSGAGLVAGVCRKKKEEEEV